MLGRSVRDNSLDSSGDSFDVEVLLFSVEKGGVGEKRVTPAGPSEVNELSGSVGIPKKAQICR